MNPEFLESEELDYEMSIRKIYLDTRRKKTSALSKILIEERDGLRSLPGYTGLDPEEEIVSCGVMLDLLKMGLEVAINQRDENELNRCRTKFLHIQSRSQRIVPVTSTSVASHASLLNLIQEVDTKMKSLYKRSSQPTLTSVRPSFTPPNVVNEPGIQNLNPLPLGNNNSIDLLSGNSDSDTVGPSFDQFPINNEQGAGLPPPILPSTASFVSPQPKVDDTINKRFERLEEMIEKLSMSMSLRSEADKRHQHNPVREPPRDFRSLGAVRKSTYDPPTAPTWNLPFVRNPTSTVDNNQGRFSNYNPLNYNQNPIHHEQCRYDPNIRYNQSNQQNPIGNSSFISDNNHSNQRSNHGQNSFYGGRKPIPVHKWRISFDGENDLNDFLSKVEMYTKFESTPDDVLMSSIGYLFSKRALSWYRVHYKEYERWTDLRTALVEEFLPSHSDFQISNQINSRFQSKNESFGEYLAAMQMLFSYMSEPPNTSHQLQLIRRNMDPTYMFALSTQEIVTIKQLAQICRRLDDTKDMIQMRSKSSNSFSTNLSPYPSKKVQFNELAGECESDLEVAALTVQRRSEKPTPNEQFSRKTPPVITCWNCLQPGHTFNYCPQEKLRLFCFTCGMHNTSRPKCPKCGPGNPRPGSQSPK